LGEAQLDRLASAVAVYKGYRSLIPGSLPFWPLGLPVWDDEWVATGLDAGSTAFVTVWRRGGVDHVDLPLRVVAGSVSLVFPVDTGVTTEVLGDVLRVTVPTVPGAVVIQFDRL
jgi:alpha-galactosidase